MPEPRTTTSSPITGQRVELARYTLPTGTRVIYGQRVDGAVPPHRRAHHPRSRIPHERGLHSYAELQAIVADYLRQAAMRHTIPARIPWLGSK